MGFSTNQGEGVLSHKPDTAPERDLSILAVLWGYQPAVLGGVVGFAPTRQQTRDPALTSGHTATSWLFKTTTVLLSVWEEIN